MAGDYKMTNGFKTARRIINSPITAYAVAFGAANGIIIAGFVFGWWETLYGP